MDKESQKMKILNYCKEHGSITIRDACVKLNINSPTKRISEMRHSSLYDVKTIEETRVKEGQTVRFNRYFINKAGAS